MDLQRYLLQLQSHSIDKIKLLWILENASKQTLIDMADTVSFICEEQPVLSSAVASLYSRHHMAFPSVISDDEMEQSLISRIEAVRHYELSELIRVSILPFIHLAGAV